MLNLMFGKDVITRNYWGGLKWDIELSRRLNNSIYLENHGYKVYSQNDEDGIVHEIFKRIGTTNKIFIEFGVQNGLECNSHCLFHMGWSGLWIEGSPKSCEQVKRLFKSVVNNGRLKVINSFITKDNINNIIKGAGYSGEIDLLSIDIDGNDYHVWEAIDEVTPRAVIIEYNAKFPPDCEWVMPYKSDYVWDGSDKQGASLKSYELLGIKKGYTLVGTNFNGINAFFVRSDLIGDKFPSPAISENLYNPIRSNFIFKSGHPTSRCLAYEENCVNEKIRPTIKQILKRKVKGLIRGLTY